MTTARRPHRCAGTTAARPRDRRPPALVLVLALVVLTATLGAPSAARAGTYAMHVCRTPDGARVDMSPWSAVKRLNGSRWHLRDNCPAGPYEMELSGAATHPSDDYLYARLVAPADTTIESYELWRSVQLASGYGWRFRHRTAAGYTELDRCFAALRCMGRGDAGAPFGTANRLAAAGLREITGLELVLTCAINDASTEACPATAPGAIVQLHGGTLTFRDDHDPTFATAPSGPLVDPARTLTGRQPVAIAVADRGGGVQQAQLEVDGRVVETHRIDDNGGLCVLPYRVPVPCKLNASAEVSLDTSALSDGEHQLRIVVVDATGQNSTAWGPLTIRTANSSCNPAPRSRALKLTTRLTTPRARPRRVVTTRYGRRLRVAGQLLRPDGAPVGGARLCVVSREATPDAPLRPAGSVTTDPAGRFSYVVPRGSSRRVAFVHRVPDGAVVDTVTTRVRAPVTLRGARRALRNGETLRLRGRLGAPPFPARGALVELQARRATGWQTFGTTRTNGRGRFQYDYTFSRTTGVLAYTMRARVPKQPSYPFATGGSRPVRVIVRG